MLDMGILNEIIAPEINGLYGVNVMRELAELIALYDFYDGRGQLWATPEEAEYTPTRAVTNYAKKLIKAQARFMFGRPPEVTITADGEEQTQALRSAFRKIWEENGLSAKLLKAGRDCFIGKRVAVKLWGGSQGVKICFRPSLEFVYDVETDQSEELVKIVFFYGMNDEKDKLEQRIWKQKFEMVDGKCLLTEAVFDGYGTVISVSAERADTGLDFIPAFVVVNDGLSGDLSGESDIAELKDNQSLYNRLMSDNIDTLKFNMFPIRVAQDADGESVRNIRIAPNALVDLQTEPIAAESGKSAALKLLESGFTYASSFEETIKQVKNNMFELMSVPNVGLEQLRGLMQSGKSMKTLYWELICKVEERWQAWDAMLRWLAEKSLQMCRVLGGEDIPDCPFSVDIEHLYPILDDEEAERALDLQEVVANVRSRKSYAEKWNINADGAAELSQVCGELEQLE